MLLSLVIPTYNERENITQLIFQVTSILEKITKDFEIIVVDDNSSDYTWQIAEELAVGNPHLKVLRRCNERGLATAVVDGWKAARGKILGVMDGDLQHPPETLQELLNSMLATDADIIVASRNVTGGGVSEWSFIRRFLSWGATLFTTLLLPGILHAVRDPMSGYFLIRRSVIESARLKPVGYKILLEVLARGKYKTVAEVPYVFRERSEGGSKLGPQQYREFFIQIQRLAWETGQLKRFLRYCIVGFSGVFVNEGALKVFTDFGGLFYIYSSFLAVELAIVNNFVLNEFWTFRDMSRHQPNKINRFKRFVKFNLICSVGAFLNVLVLWVLTDLSGLYYLASNLFGIGISTLWNYGFNSNITWEVPVRHRTSKPLSRK